MARALPHSRQFAELIRIGDDQEVPGLAVRRRRRSPTGLGTVRCDCASLAGVLRRVFDYAVQDGAIPQSQSGPSELVFPSANSTPLRNRNFRRDSFDAATAALGLTITPRNLRDTAASLAIQAGASVVALARLLGHEWAATTLNHYAGLFPTDLDDVAVRLDAAPRGSIGDQ